MSANQKDIYAAVGLMSGTSMDGSIDAALLMTDGEGVIERTCVVTHRYEVPGAPRAFYLFMKSAELAVRQADGDLTKAEALLPSVLLEYLAQTFSISMKEAEKKRTELHSILFGAITPSRLIEALSDLSAAYHAEAVLHLLKTQKRLARDVDVVGYHGQTLYHNPARGRTVQVGNARLVADRTGIDVVSDFRSNDVRHGGQGAPLAPLYHQALARAAGLGPVAVVNLGGCSNVTIVTANEADLLAFDAGPANGLLDRFMLERTGQAMDKDGAHALRGTVNEAVLALLVENSIEKEGLNFLKVPPPKSLDIRDFVLIPELTTLSVEDGAATLSAFSAECIALSLDFVVARALPLPTDWILCGGGAFNPAIVGELTARLTRRIGAKVTLRPADDFGWSVQGMEAELFAYLAVRSLKGLPLSLSGTTGVSKPCTGGIMTVAAGR